MARSYKTIVKNGTSVRVRTDGPPIIAADGTRCYKFAGASYHDDPVLAKLTVVQRKGITMNKLDKGSTDASATAVDFHYVPGMVREFSDEELKQTLSLGKPNIPRDPVPTSIYERRSLYDDAVLEVKRRSGNNALSDPSRSEVQMQTGKPEKPVGQFSPVIPNASTMRTPAERMTDEELAAAATAAPDQLPYGNELSGADYARVQAGREAKREIMRRATSATEGKRINPTNWN